MKRTGPALLAILVLAAASCTTGRGKLEKLSDRLLSFPPIDFAGDVFVDLSARAADYERIAVVPFKAPVELAGQSISDVFSTELLKTKRYQLVERGQLDAVLKEQEVGLSGVIDDNKAIQVGKLVGARGVVVGTVPEYGFQKSGFSKVASVGLSVRMIDTTTGRIVWSVSHSAVAKNKKLSLSQQVAVMVGDMVAALGRQWAEAGDTSASGLPPPEIVRTLGLVRKVALEWKAHPSTEIAGFEIWRKGPEQAEPVQVIRLKNTRSGTMLYEDEGLLDMTQYDYEVRTVSRYGLVSGRAARAEVTTAGPPEPPAGVAAAGGIRQVVLTWQPSADPSVAGYVIRREDPGKKETAVAWVNGRQARQYVDGGDARQKLADSTLYSYRVATYNTVNTEGPPSPAVKAVTWPPPSRVTGLKAKNRVSQSVPLEWKPNPDSEEVDGYLVGRGLQAEGPFLEIARVEGMNTTRYTDRKSGALDMKDGATYYYRVAAYNRGDVAGQWSEATKATTKPIPGKVTGVSASGGSVREIQLKWQRSQEPDIASYVVYRSSAGAAGSFRKVGSVSAETPAFGDTGIGDGDSYYYCVSAVDRDGLEGEMSEPARGKAKASPPPPTEVTCTAGNGQAEIRWKREKETVVQKYVVYQKSWQGTRRVGEALGDRYTARDLEAGREYVFTVRSVSEDGVEGRDSLPVKCKLAP